MPDEGDHEAFVAADYNADMIAQALRHELGYRAATLIAQLV
jgi:hypothetical protein